MTEEQKAAKYKIVSQASYLVLMSAALFILFIYKKRRESDLTGMMYDVQTIDINDYSIEVNISNEMWEEFTSNTYRNYESQVKKNKGEVMSSAMYLKEYLSKEIPKILKEYLKEVADFEK